MKKIKLSFYLIAIASILPGFALAFFLALHPWPADFQLYQLVTSFKWQLLSHYSGYVTEPPYWIPLYNGLLILLYYVFGTKFMQVIYGLLGLFLVVYLLSTLTTYFGLADQAHFELLGLHPEEIAHMKKWGLFSYRHIALVFSLATYLSIVLNNEYLWVKISFLCCACILLFCCIYNHHLLPFSAITAAILGNLTACLLAPLYIRRVIYPEVT